MVELADAADSKSAEGNLVGVRPPLPAPHKIRTYAKLASLTREAKLFGGRFSMQTQRRIDLFSRGDQELDKLHTNTAPQKPNTGNLPPAKDRSLARDGGLQSPLPLLIRFNSRCETNAALLAEAPPCKRGH